MRLNAVRMGEGRRVVLLHGLLGQAQNFGTIQKTLAGQGFQVLALDQRNHGFSPHAAGMAYPTLAADVAETLEAEGFNPAAIIGHSMGGKTAMALALTRPELVERLIVADIAPVRYNAVFRAYVAAMRAIPLKPGLTRREADAALVEAVPDASLRGFLLQGLLFAEAPPRWRIGLDEIAAAMPEIEDWPGLPGQYRGKVLVLAGETSDYIRPEHRSLFEAMFPNLRFASVPRAGHWVHAENPKGFLEAITPFLVE